MKLELQITLAGFSDFLKLFRHYGDKFMATFDEVKASLDALVAREDEIIQALKDLRDAGGASPAQLDELLATISAQQADQATV
ncbi:MAG: hypothetical protein ABL879_18480 [Devosia sp.]